MVYHVSSVIGGAELQVKYIVDYLLKNTSHKIFFLCRESAINKYQEIEILKTKPPRYIGKYFKCADFFSINKYLNRIKPDIIYTRVSTAYVGIAAHYCKRHHAKLIYHIAHKKDVTPVKTIGLKGVPMLLERWIYLYGLKNADIIIGQANYQNQLLKKNYNRTCTAIVPNFHPYSQTIKKVDKPINVVWIANLKTSKQPELFIELAKEFISYEKVKFIMVGALLNGNYKNSLQEVEYLHNIAYLGQLPIEEVNEILANSHIFINTSLKGEEGFPNTFIQAWMREVPVISLNVDPGDIIKSNKLGYHSLTLKKLTEDLKTLIENKNLRNNMGIRARIFANNNYGLKNIELLLKLIQ